MKLNDHAFVCAASSLSLLALVIVLRSVLLVSGNILSRDIILLILLYSAGTVLYHIRRGKGRGGWREDPRLWGAGFVLFSLLLAVLYAS
ncbi:MAG: hypothetical protein WB626_03500 [Bacteroidota bacterium]